MAALSTTEVEYIVVTEGVKEDTWLRGLIIQLGVPQGVTTMFSDSQSAIHLTKSDAYHSIRPSILVSSTIISETPLL